MLQALRDKEEGLLGLVLYFADAKTLAELALASSWTRALCIRAADLRITQLIQNDQRVSRWRRMWYSQSGDVLREAYHIECAAAYIDRVAGRYRLSSTVMLDISPTGHFVNYSTGSIDEVAVINDDGSVDVAHGGHCFRGFTTVAGVLPVTGHDDFLYLLDRWYITCWQCGREVPAASLGFVGPGYQCYSVSGLQEGGVRSGRPVPVLYENRPGPDAEQAWRVPTSQPVLWRQLPGEYGPQHLVSDATNDLLALQISSRYGNAVPLCQVAERQESWPAGGLAPIADTREDEGLRARWPPLRHYDPKLTDLRISVP